MDGFDQLSLVPSLRDADAGTEIGGLDEAWIPEAFLDSRRMRPSSWSQEARVNPTQRACGIPTAEKICFIAILSIPKAEASTPAPTYGMPTISRRPWMVPSSPNVPCKTGKTTSISFRSAGGSQSGERLASTGDKP